MVEREVIWSSPVLLTPYVSAARINFHAIQHFIHDCYHGAGLHGADIDTGAVVITGEALKKENAQPIVDYFSRSSGKFICASAGPHHEALLAAHGSGAVQLSRAHGDRVLNVDIGGGTTKLSLVVAGAVVATAAINVGARLIAYDQAGIVSRLEDAAGVIARGAGIELDLGAVLDAAGRRRLGETMAGLLIDVLLNGDAAGPLARELMITPPLAGYRGLDSVDHLVFSGGVSEYVYRRTDQAFGDLGAIIGEVVRDFLDGLPAGKLVASSHGIRATVIGASEYTIQISGATSYASSTTALPVRGYKVIPVAHQAGAPFADALAAALTNFDLDGFGPGLVVALSVAGDVDYCRLREIASGLADLAATATDCPLIVTIEEDIAKVVGRLLKDEFGVANDVICIDGIRVGDLDYIDIGLPVSMLDLYPVTVKSLLFTPNAHRMLQECE